MAVWGKLERRDLNSVGGHSGTLAQARALGTGERRIWWVTMHPRATRSWFHFVGCVGFWLWALVGAAVAFGFISFVGWFAMVPAAGVAYLLTRRSDWKDGPVLGLVTGAGLPLLFVAALHWNSWQHRIPGDNTPNPYDWGGVGLCLVIAGMVAYTVGGRRT